MNTHHRLLPVGFLLALASAALADETRTLVTIASQKGGYLAVLPDGSRVTLTGELGEVVDEFAEAVTVGGTPGADGKTFAVAWIRAVVKKPIDLGQGASLAPGVVLKVTGRQQEVDDPEEPEEVYTSWNVELPDGTRRLLDSKYEHAIDLVPAERVIQSGWVQGVVEAGAGERVSVAGESGRVSIVGAQRPLLARNAGRYVQATAVYYLARPTPTAEVIEVSANCRGKVAFHQGRPNGPVKLSTANEHHYVSQGPKGWLRLRDGRRFVKETDMEIGHEWLELTGVVVEKTEGNSSRFQIEAPGRTIQVAYGFASDEVSDDVLKKAVGRRVTVRGDVESGAIRELTMRSIDGAIVADLPAEGDRPAIAAGTKVKVLDGRTSSEGGVYGLVHEIELANGKRYTLSIAHQDKVQVGEPAAAGFTSQLPE